MSEVERLGAAQRQCLLDFQQRMTLATARVYEAPAAGIDELDAVLRDVPEVHARALGLGAALDARLPGQAGASAGWIDAQAAQWRASLELTLAMACYRIGQGPRCATHLTNCLGLTQGQRDPQRAMALQLLARLALDAGRPDLAREHVAALEPEALSWTDAAAWQGWAPEGQEAAAALAAGRQVAAALAMHADVALVEGDRDAYLRLIGEAIRRAEAAGADDDVRVSWWARAQYELIWDSTGQRLDTADATLRAAAPASVRNRPDFAWRLLQLRAHVWANRGRGDTARRLLEQALASVPAGDFSAWSVHLDLADVLSVAGDHGQALRHADAAVLLASQADSPMLVRRCADHRRGLQMASGDAAMMTQALAELDAETRAAAAVDAGEPLGDTASRLQTRVQLLLALRRPREALATVDDIAALPAAARHQAAIGEVALATMRAAALRVDGRVAEAAEVLENAAQDWAAAAQAPGAGPSGGAPMAGSAAATTETPPEAPTAWRDRSHQWQSLALGAALQRADLGQAERAFHWVERAREPMWNASFERHRLGGLSVDLPSLRVRLQQRRSAVLALVLGRQRTAALVLPADGGEPWSRMLPVGEGDWRERLSDMERGEAAWNPRFADNLDTFSAWLGPLLADATRGADLLCLVPEGPLAMLPFAGLALPDGRPLALHCASALLPALRFACRDLGPREGASAAPQRRLLSAGAGRSLAVDGRVLHDFDAMAAEVAQAYASGPVQLLADAPLARFLAEAPGFDALHLSFHGNVQPGQLDPLAASTLQFQGAERLSARRLAEHWAGGVGFEHVFVNACVSAGFAFARDAGAGGFWQALVGVGARAVTGTLAYVDPAQAQALALAFYRHWRGDLGVAQALCEAQRELHRGGLGPAAWATHMAVVTGL
jgi:tetratricopeptide (TPR) repeat protein